MTKDAKTQAKEFVLNALKTAKADSLYGEMYYAKNGALEEAKKHLNEAKTSDELNYWVEVMQEISIFKKQNDEQ